MCVHIGSPRDAPDHDALADFLAHLDGPAKSNRGPVPIILSIFIIIVAGGHRSGSNRRKRPPRRRVVERHRRLGRGRLLRHDRKAGRARDNVEPNGYGAISMLKNYRSPRFAHCDARPPEVCDARPRSLNFHCDARPPQVCDARPH